MVTPVPPMDVLADEKLRDEHLSFPSPMRCQCKLVLGITWNLRGRWSFLFGSSLCPAVLVKDLIGHVQIAGVPDRAEPDDRHKLTFY